MHSAVVLNNQIYVIGGGNGLNTPVVPTVEVYEPSTDSWITKSDMPTPRSHLATAVVGGKIYAIGGCVGPPNWSGLANVEVYEPAKDTWSIKSKMPTARLEPHASVLDGKIYVMGGTTEDNPYPGFQTVEVYIPN
jgi:N-acetylneuraminic acid mutarotase